jgi:hypothetical protein
MTGSRIGQHSSSFWYSAAAYCLEDLGTNYNGEEGGDVYLYFIDKVMCDTVWIHCPWRLALQYIWDLTTYAVGLAVNETACRPP